ncbi:HAD-IB family hydrolase [Neorhizobium sp. JUb45]|uniref:HAD family hydrolase n=1 Tax=unclassified Neorhizobium TaxID=2629175 RepID=UPI00104CA6A2|nr:HAD-IB family hydrolase [Neorhizobium sp. JUb45]TCR03024.1 HAD superfamily hydrolase (TIGR01490 family) [Neorhizobium sp. JUb45]
MDQLFRSDEAFKRMGGLDESTPYLAVFDVDETLVSVKSMFSFLRFVLISEHGMPHGVALYGAVRNKLEALRSRASREDVNREFYRLFRHRGINRLRLLAQEWFAEEVASHPDLFIPETCALLREHRERGAGIVFLSGSADFILEPIVDHLGGGAIVANRLAEEKGVTTGELKGIQTIGSGKREALRQYVEEHGLNFRGSVAVGDHISDLPFLELAQHPVVVRGDLELEQIAISRGWTMIEPNQPAYVV